MVYQQTVLSGMALLVVFLGQQSAELAAAQFDTDPYCEKTGGELSIPDSVLATIENADQTASFDEQAEAVLQKAALEIAYAAQDSEACRATFKNGQDKFDSLLRRGQNLMKRKGRFTPSEDVTIATIQDEVTRRWRDDQIAREVYVRLKTEDKSGADFWAQRLATANAVRADGSSKRYLETILDEFDWLDIHRFGEPVSAHAWILIQHADEDPELQTLVLERMKGYLKNGGVTASNYCHLWDRVAVNTDRKQRYGTQPIWECKNGTLELQPMEGDVASANKLRAEMGMEETIEEGLARMAKFSCRK